MPFDPARFVNPVRLSPIVAGCWRMAEWGHDVAARVRWIEAALALGVTAFDHADLYGDYTVEGLFGEALAAAPGLRDRLQLVTKCGIKLVSARRPAHRVKSYDISRAHVVSSVEASLHALRTDRIDLLLIHRPDALMDPAALARTFEDLKAAGKVLHVGVSNHAPSQLALLQRFHPLASHQVEFSPLEPRALDDGTLDQCLMLGIRPMAWSPLGGGRLFATDDAAALRVRNALAALAERYDVSPSTLAYAWILRHPASSGRAAAGDRQRPDRTPARGCRRACARATGRGLVRGARGGPRRTGALSRSPRRGIDEPWLARRAACARP